jgi:hypothetical protein
MRREVATRPTCRVLAALLCLAAGGRVGHAQAIDAARRAFVTRFVAAIASCDATELKQLYDPASLACATPANHDYFDFVFEVELSYAAALRGGYVLTRFAAIDPAIAAASEFGGLFTNPVWPTHQFQIDTPSDGCHASLTLMRPVARRDGAWFIVVGCPSVRGLAFFRERRAEGEAQRARAGELAAALREPLLSEIRGLLAQHQRVAAIKRYQGAAKVDPTTAAQVIDVLAAR